MTHISFPNQWSGQSSSTHLESCCIARLKVFTQIRLYLYSKELPRVIQRFFHLLICFWESIILIPKFYLKTETLKDNIVSKTPVEIVSIQVIQINHILFFFFFNWLCFGGCGQWGSWVLVHWQREPGRRRSWWIHCGPFWGWVACKMFIQMEMSCMQLHIYGAWKEITSRCVHLGDIYR